MSMLDWFYIMLSMSQKIAIANRMIYVVILHFCLHSAFENTI